MMIFGLEGLPYSVTGIPENHLFPSYSSAAGKLVFISSSKLICNAQITIPAHFMDPCMKLKS